MIERNIDKNSWRLNLPAEFMEKLGWNKGDTILLDIQNEKLVAIKADEEMIKKNRKEQKELIKNNFNEGRYPNGKKIPPKKKTPCGLFEFTKRKYADNKCRKCNADYELLIQNPGIHCPIAEQNTKEITKEIAENLNNEDRITINDLKDVININSKILKTNKKIAKTIDDINESTEYVKVKQISDVHKKENEEINKQVEKQKIKSKLKELKEDYNEISKTEIRFLSYCSNEEKIKYSRQMICPVCGNEMIENCGIVRNNKLVCKECKNKVLNEIKEVCKLQKEIKELKRKEENLK